MGLRNAKFSRKDAKALSHSVAFLLAKVARKGLPAFRLRIAFPIAIKTQKLRNATVTTLAQKNTAQ